MVLQGVCVSLSVCRGAAGRCVSNVCVVVLQGVCVQRLDSAAVRNYYLLICVR